MWRRSVRRLEPLQERFLELHEARSSLSLLVSRQTHSQLDLSAGEGRWRRRRQETAASSYNNRRRPEKGSGGLSCGMRVCLIILLRAWTHATTESEEGVTPLPPSLTTRHAHSFVKTADRRTEIRSSLLSWLGGALPRGSLQQHPLQTTPSLNKLLYMYIFYIFICIVIYGYQECMLVCAQTRVVTTHTPNSSLHPHAVQQRQHIHPPPARPES